MSRWPEVPLREVLSEYREYIDSPGARSYAKLSVKLYGKGVVLDAPADGAALKMKKHQLARAGQVILSEIWGKKGAIGLVPPEGDGALCTSHFFLFDLNHDRVLPGWLAAIFRANYLEEQLAGGAFGTTGYAAVRPKTLLSARIPLPPLPEQQRVVARIEGLATEFHGACFIRQQSMKLADVLMDATSNEVMSRLVDSCPLERLDKLTVLIADVNHEMPIAVEAGLPFVSPRDFVPKGIAYAGAKRISTLDFDRLSRKCKPQRGDLLMARYGTVGAVRMVTTDLEFLASYSIAVIRPDLARADATFLYWALVSPYVQRQIKDGIRGAIQADFGLKTIRQLLIPRPRMDEQHRVVAYLEGVAARVDALKALHEDTAAELDALMPSILDKAFRGEL